MKIQSLLFLASFGLVLSACPPSQEGDDAAVVDAGTTHADAAVADSAAGDAVSADVNTDTDASQPAPSCDNDDSYEDNDTEDSAAEITAPGTLDNLVGCDEFDWYKFTVPANNGLSVDLAFSDEASDLDLFVYAASDTTNSLDRSVSTTDNEHVSYELFAQATPVLLKVKNFGYPDSQTDYSMTVAFHEGGYCENDNYEPNQSAASAASMTGRHLSAKLCNGDTDYYSFSLNTAGPGATVSVEREDTALDIALYVEGSNTAIGDVSHDEDNHIDRITFDSALDTTYILKIAGSDIVYYSVDVKGPPPANDLCADAPVLPMNSTVNGSTVDANNDYEFATDYNSCAGFDMDGPDVAYRVNVPADQYLHASLDSEKDLALYLLDDCTSRCCWVGVDDAFSNEQENLRYHNVTGAAQDLFLIVDSFSSYTQSDFVLQAELTDSAPIEDGGVADDAGPEPTSCQPDEVADAGVAEDAS